MKYISDVGQFISFLHEAEVLTQSYAHENAIKLIYQFIAVSLIVFIIWFIYERDKKKGTRKATSVSQARHFPISLPFVNGFYTLYQLRQGGIKQIEEWFKKFGKIFELPFGTKSVVFVADPGAVQKILTSSNPEHLNKPAYVYDRMFVDMMNGGLVNSEYQIWSRHRKMVSSAFSYKSLQAWLPHLDSHAYQLCKSLLEKCSVENKQELETDDVWDLLLVQNGKVITQFAGGSAEIVSDSEFHQYYKEFHRYKALVLERLWNPQLHFLPYWFFHPLRKEYERLRNSFDDRVRKGIQDSIKKETAMKQGLNLSIDNIKENGQSPETERRTFHSSDTSAFNSLVEWMIKRNATEKEIHKEVSTLMAAGYDTVGTAIQLMLLHLALNPKEQNLCREEVDTVFASKCNATCSKTEPYGQNLDMNDLSALKHLERCVHETLRLTSVAPVFFRRLDSPLVLDNNVELPGGTMVAVASWVLHRDPEIFPNPMVFDSERFTADNVKSRHPYAFIPFSGGMRNCIGYKVAIMQMKVMVARILQHFVASTTDQLDSVKLLYQGTLAFEREYNITLHRR